MPFAGYPSWDACIAANQDKDDPSAYCGAIEAAVGKLNAAHARKDLTGDVHVATAIGTSLATARRRAKPAPGVDISIIRAGADEDEADVAKAAGATYLDTLLETCKAYLPPMLYQDLHRRVLPKSGGRANAARLKALRDAAAALVTDPTVDKRSADGLPAQVVLVEGFVSTAAALAKGTCLPVALHGHSSGRSFLFPARLFYPALRKAANALGLALRYEGVTARTHAARAPLYDLALVRHADPEPATPAGPHGPRLVKADAAQQKVWGVVLEPLRVDTQGDFEEQAAIEAACHQFMADYRLRKANLGHSHERPMTDEEAVLCENYCTSGPATIGGEAVPAGTWVQVWHLKSAPLWKSVEDGAFTGFSFGGTGVREPLPEGELPPTLKRAGAA